MTKRIGQVLLFCALLLSASGLAAQSLSEASREAARKYNAEVISAKTEVNGQKKVHVIKLLTRDGVVKTVRVPVKEKKKG